MKPNPKLIIFDWDDVITLGAKEGYFACYDHALESVNIHLPLDIKTERILKKWGKNHVEELKELLQEHPELVETAVKAYEEAFFGDVFVNSLRINSGTIEAITKLSLNHKLAVATGGHPKVLKEHIFPRFDIPKVFDVIISAYEISDPTKTKPDPYMLNTIMEKLEISRNETIYVGDAENDVIMARNAQVTPVVVLTGHLNKEKALSLNVDYIIDRVSNLEEILQ